MSFASAEAVVARAMAAWRPPEKLSLSAWSERNYRLSSESAAEPGRFKPFPFQVGILDAMSDPATEEVTLMKSARTGYTSMLCAGIGYYIEHDPCSQLVVQPTVDDGKEFSKETIAPMLRDVPVLAQIRVHDLEEKGAKDSSNTLTHKAFPGGILSITGANSGTGFRRKTRRVVWFDEVDAYPPSAGNEGDPIKLGKKRNETFWNRKTIAGSTPLIAGASRIEEMYESGDKRRYYVPCPHCEHMDFLTFREQIGENARGHWMAFDSSSPEAAFATAHFICRGCGCEIGHEHKRWMVERGEWRAERPFHGHASFHIWSAYSYSPGATWGHIAKEFVESNQVGADRQEKLQTFVNTTLGETWTEKGEAPDWQRLVDRREGYQGDGGGPRLVTVPAGALFLTAGMDVQADRLVYEVVAWMDDFQSWSLEADVIMGDTAKAETWAKADELLARSWPGAADGAQHHIRLLAVDSGFNTQTVYNWARHKPRVLACKGSSTAVTMLGQPKNVDVKLEGRRIARGAKMWIVGVDLVKAELYGWLRLEKPAAAGAPFPPGYCHFPTTYGEEYFKQLTAEQRVKIRKKTGFTHLEWQLIAGRENHFLDCRVYARAAAYRCKLDRIVAARLARGARPAPPPAPQRPASDVEQAARAPAPSPRQAGERPRGPGGGSGRGGSWRSRWR